MEQSVMIPMTMVMVMQFVVTCNDGYRNGCMRTQSQPTKRDTPHHHNITPRQQKKNETQNSEKEYVIMTSS